MSDENVPSIPAADAPQPDFLTVSEEVARIAAHEMSRLWQAHGIIALAVHAIGDEVDNGGPAIKEALQGAADIIFASINGLEPICTSDEVHS